MQAWPPAVRLGNGSPAPLRCTAHACSQRVLRRPAAHHFIRQDAAVHAGGTQALGGLIQKLDTLHLHGRARAKCAAPRWAARWLLHACARPSGACQPRPSTVKGSTCLVRAQVAADVGVYHHRRDRPPRRQQPLAAAILRGVEQHGAFGSRVVQGVRLGWLARCACCPAAAQDARLPQSAGAAAAQAAWALEAATGRLGAGGRNWRCCQGGWRGGCGLHERCAAPARQESALREEVGACGPESTIKHWQAGHASSTHSLELLSIHGLLHFHLPAHKEALNMIVGAPGST